MLSIHQLWPRHLGKQQVSQKAGEYLTYIHQVTGTTLLLRVSWINMTSTFKILQADDMMSAVPISVYLMFVLKLKMIC